MANSPAASESSGRPRIFGKTKVAALVVLLALLVLCLSFAWTTRDAMAHLKFLRGQSGNSAKGLKTLVDLQPWQTIQALAPLAVTAEETEYAHDAERLAGHEVDQAFVSALLVNSMQVERRAYSGDALALSQKVSQLKLATQQDQEQIDLLMGKPSAASGQGKSSSNAGGDDLEVAKAQLELDSDELADAQNDLARVSGDNTAQIQAELAAHEAAMQLYNSKPGGDGQVALLSAKQHGTLVARLQAWSDQNGRLQLMQQALGQTQQDIAALTAERNSLQARISDSTTASAKTATDHGAWLASIKDRNAERKILGICNDRIQTEQQLAAVYGKWSAQVQLQHRIVLHMMLQSLVLIVLIGICMVLGDALVRYLMAHPALDGRQAQTLRSIFELGVQVLGVVLILLVIFGVPQQTSTILGLATAALTIALQDFILAFLGWFVLVGKNGIHVGDRVEINGVHGEVTEVGLFSTSMLETGKIVEKGLWTGRRISFLNSFAIRGQYFNFTTAGQWMWDEITLNIPADAEVQATAERIRQAVLQETQENTRIAQQEWERGTHGNARHRFDATPALTLRPSPKGVDLEVRYVTHAAERDDLRNRLYQHLLELLPAQSGKDDAA